MEVREPSAKYLARPAFKQTEVGEIPEDWEARQIHEFASVKTGPFGTLLKASEYSGGEGVPLISVGEIRDGFIRISDETPLVPDAVVRRLPQYVLHRGDIVFGRKGGVERSAPIRQEHEGCFLGSDGICVRPMEGSHPEYLASQFQSHRVQEWLLQHSSGTTMPSLNQEILRRVQIPLPPTSAEQQAIADALGDADALIESLEHLLAKKRQIKQGTMQALLTGQQRLPGFEGEWLFKQLGDIAVIDPDNLTSATPPDFQFNYISLEDVEEGQLRGHSQQRFETSPSRARRRLRKNDVLVSTVRPNLKSHLYFQSDASDWVCSTGFCVVRSVGHLLHPGFLFALLFSELIIQQIDALLTGSNYPAINSGDVRALNVPVPTYPEQVAIAEILIDMDAEIAALDAKLAKARALKQGMMQALLTGRIRLV